MIKPNKYTDINLSIVGISVTIIKMLKSENFLKYNTALEKTVLLKGNDAKQNFLLALIFLFSLGKIKYHKTEDVLELI